MSSCKNLMPYKHMAKTKRPAVYPEKGHRPSLIPYIGGKSQLIGSIVPLIEYAVEHYQLDEYWEVCGGGARMLLNLPPTRLSKRVYNEYDESLCALFHCLTIPELTYELIEVLERQGVGEDVFLRAKQLKENCKVGDEGYDVVAAAACAYIVASQSRAAMQQIFNPCMLTPNRKQSYMNRIRTLHTFFTTTEGLVVRNENVLQLLREPRYWENCFLYIDPPYAPEEMCQDEHYSLNFTSNDHEQLVDLLLKLPNAKIALSGYDTPIYQRLVDHGWKKMFLKSVHVPSAVVGRYQDEYLWINFDIPNHLEEQVSELRMES